MTSLTLIRVYTNRAEIADQFNKYFQLLIWVQTWLKGGKL